MSVADGAAAKRNVRSPAPARQISSLDPADTQPRMPDPEAVFREIVHSQGLPSRSDIALSRIGGGTATC